MLKVKYTEEHLIHDSSSIPFVNVAVVVGVVNVAVVVGISAVVVVDVGGVDVVGISVVVVGRSSFSLFYRVSIKTSKCFFLQFLEVKTEFLKLLKA